MCIRRVLSSSLSFGSHSRFKRIQIKIAVVIVCDFSTWNKWQLNERPSKFGRGTNPYGVNMCSVTLCSAVLCCAMLCHNVKASVMQTFSALFPFYSYSRFFVLCFALRSSVRSIIMDGSSPVWMWGMFSIYAWMYGLFVAMHVSEQP